ncbi:MAG: TRAM domain-containing protein [bacterium]
MTPSVPSPQSTDTATLPLWEDVGIVDLNAQGEGVGRHDGQVVFVPYTIPGEIIDVQVIAKRPNFARGALERLRMTAPTRATPQCPHFAVCGGCQY